MRNMFILYDSSCELCGQCKGWIQNQNQSVQVTFIAAGSPEARRIFPNLNHEQTLKELTVIADNGAVYHGTKAWLMCLWALREYRGWSRTLASPEMMPVARKFITMVSDNRQAINKAINKLALHS